MNEVACFSEFERLRELVNTLRERVDIEDKLPLYLKLQIARKEIGLEHSFECEFEGAIFFYLALRATKGEKLSIKETLGMMEKLCEKYLVQTT